MLTLEDAARKGIQNGALVRAGLLECRTPKAYTGGTIGQDIGFKDDNELHAHYDVIKNMLMNAGSENDGVCQVINRLVGMQGLEIVAEKEGLHVP